MSGIDANSNLDQEYLNTLKPTSITAYKWAAKLFQAFLFERSDVRNEEVVFVGFYPPKQFLTDKLLNQWFRVDFQQQKSVGNVTMLQCRVPFSKKVAYDSSTFLL